MRDPELSVIVPCLDEEDNVVTTLGELGDVLRGAGVESFEILLLDDASSGGTFERSVAYAAQRPELGIRTFRRREPGRGYGAVVRHGLAHARGESRVTVSGDGVDPVRRVPEMLRLARAGAELVSDVLARVYLHRLGILWF